MLCVVLHSPLTLHSLTQSLVFDVYRTMSSQLSAAEEAKAVQTVWKSKLEKDETWCVLEAKWFKKWCKFSGFNPKESDPQRGVESMTIHDAERPGPIDNAPILEGTLLLVLMFVAACMHAYVLSHSNCDPQQQITADLS
jgi:hypothetical protein